MWFFTISYERVWLTRLRAFNYAFTRERYQRFHLISFGRPNFYNHVHASTQPPAASF